MEDVSNSNEGDVHAGSEISPQLPPLQSDHQSTNDVPLSWASRPPDDERPWHRPPPIIPPLHSSWQFESSNGTEDKRHSFHSTPEFRSHPYFHHHSLPVPPPFQSSSIKLDGINPTTTNTNPSSIQIVPPVIPPHHIYRNPPASIQQFHAQSSMARTIDSTTSTYSRESSLKSNVPSTVKSPVENKSYIPPSTHPPFHIVPGPNNQSTHSRASSMTSSHQKSSMMHTVHSATSTCSRESALNSSISSKVPSLAEDKSRVTPTMKPPINIPGSFNQSSHSITSSLTSSHQTVRTPSIASTSELSMPTSHGQHHIATPNSNLTSSDMVGIMNGKSPDLLYLPNDFLPSNKKHITEIHGKRFWNYAVHFDRSLPEENPDDYQMGSFLTKLNSFYEEIHDNLTKCLLSHLVVGFFFKEKSIHFQQYCLIHSTLDQGKLLQSSCRRK